jgi:hypothetical protein
MADRYGNPWSKYRVYFPKTLPPLRALRAFCLDCCCESAEEVRLCLVEGCSLWPYRFGAYPENYQGPKSVLKPIRARCLDCCGDNRAEVNRCIKQCCAIYPYRRGTNPSRTKKGGNPSHKTGPTNSGVPTHAHENDLSDQTNEEGKGKDRGSPIMILKQAKGQPFKRGQSKITTPSVANYEANSPEPGNKSG